MRLPLAPALLLVLLSACKGEPSFEERYSEAEATISEQAQSIESDLGQPGEATSIASATPQRADSD